MTTRAVEELDGGLGSCQPSEDLPTLAELCPGQPPEDRARAATPRLADSGGWPHDSREAAAEGSPEGKVDARPKKTEKEPVAKGAPGPGKEKLKAAPRSPARKKAQSAPPPQPPPPPPALSEELPWGDLSLNKCLVLASLVALLGSALQLCRDAVAGEAVAPAPVPEPWVPPGSAPKEPASPLPKPVAWAPPSGPPAPQVEAERPGVPVSREAAEQDEGEPAEERAAVADRGSKERPRKQRARKERARKEKRPRKERPQKEERPRAAREPRGALPRRWEARDAGRRPWARDSGHPEHGKRPAWASPRRPNEEDRPPGRQKARAGKGRD